MPESGVREERVVEWFRESQAPTVGGAKDERASAGLQAGEAADQLWATSEHRDDAAGVGCGFEGVPQLRVDLGRLARIGQIVQYFVDVVDALNQPQDELGPRIAFGIVGQFFELPQRERMDGKEHRHRLATLQQRLQANAHLVEFGLA
ncbi:hypothetical protein SAMN06272735_9301 [Streptomyces sp. TLI_55]|nr:hypothetical protein SAMN06272735_9301 [Streptomyces sp. TLI_55]